MSRRQPFSQRSVLPEPSAGLNASGAATDCRALSLSPSLNFCYFMNNGYIANVERKYNTPELNGETCGLVGSYITEEYELLRKVMSYLNLADLESAALVCKNWAEAAKSEQLSRAQPTLFVFQQSITKEYWKTLVNTVYCLPKLCLLFCVANFSQYLVGSENRQHPPTLLVGRLSNHLEKYECPLVTISAHGIIGTTTDLDVTEEGPCYEDHIWSAVNVLFLPKYPGVEMHTFKISNVGAKRLLEDYVPDDVLRNLVGGPNLPIRCLLLFYKAHSVASTLASLLLERQTSEFAIGGAQIQGNGDSKSQLTGVIFYGNNMSASSIVIKGKTISQIDGKVKELQDGSIDGESKVAFVFSCSSRGLKRGRTHERTKRDTESLRRNLKGTPLVGVIGFGEIGLDYLPARSVESGAKKDRQSTSSEMLTHVFTTVVVLISFNISKKEKSSHKLEMK